MVVFDLGLAPGDVRTLTRRFRTTELQPFDFHASPRHVAHLSWCAWKPIAIEQVISSRLAPILWLDAATIVHAPLDAVFSAIARDGVLTLVGQSPVERWCHPRTLELMRVTVEDRRKRCRIGGVVGFDGSNPTMRDLVTAWRDAALDPELLNPPGASRATHRWDQALLTNLLYAFERERGLVLRDEEADISSIRPVRWISTRNKVPNWVPVTADPLVRGLYTLYKSVDRAVLRLRAAAPAAMPSRGL